MKFTLHICLLFVLFISCNVNKNLTKDGSNPEEKKQLELRKKFIEANLEKNNGNIDRARKLYEQCLEIDKNNAAVNYAYSGLVYKYQDQELGLSFAQKALKNDASNTWYKLNIAEMYYQKRDYLDAAEMFKKVQLDWPEKEEYLIALAECQYKGGQIKEAINTYKHYQEQNGYSLELTEQIFKMQYFALKDTKGAITTLEETVKNNPENVNYLGLLANAYEQNGDNEKAFEEYKKIQTLDPDNGIVNFAMYRFYSQKEQFEKAFEALKKAFGSDDIELESKMDILLELYEITEKDPALLKGVFECLDTLIITHPNDAKSYAIYGDFNYREGYNKEALKMFRKSAQLDPSEEAIWNQVILLDIEVGANKEILQDSENAMELFPNQPQFYYYNGLALYKDSSYNDAIEMLETAISLIVTNNLNLKVDINKLLGDAYYKIGETITAFNFYEEVLELHPDNISVLNNYAYFLSLENKSLPKAEKMAKKVVDKFPNQASYNDTYAWVLFKSKKYSEALIYIEKSVKSRPSESVFLEHYGDILYHLNKKDEALAQWKKANIKANGTSKQLPNKIKDKKYYE